MSRVFGTGRSANLMRDLFMSEHLWVNLSSRNMQYQLSYLIFVERSIVFVWKWGPRPRTSSRCYHGSKSAATFKKGIFVHPPWVPNCMQNLKGGWKFSFPKMFDSYKDLFLSLSSSILWLRVLKAFFRSVKTPHEK